MNYCEICGEEMDGTEFYDDTCDECARTEGLLEEDEDDA